jgi:hypothetical protein
LQPERCAIRQDDDAMGAFGMHTVDTVDAARYWPSPFPASPVSEWTAWPRRIGALFKIVVQAISAALVVGIVPVAVLIVIFQEHVVSGLTSGGIKG